ncbi:MAG: DNA translocase FtsK [Candidatus Omnitrophica bacterium]|nr:DNA translocase FtsK [Candidatus Omnitrophota bacterium]
MRDLFKQTDRRSEIFAILLVAFSIFIFISLISFSYSDLPFFTSEVIKPLGNFAGIIGAYLGGILLFFMGMSAYAMPILILFWAIARFAGTKPQRFYFKIFGTLFLILAVSSTFGLLGGADVGARFKMGGFIGISFSSFLVKYLGILGAVVSIIVLLLLSILVATDFLIFPFIGFLVKSLTKFISRLKSKVILKKSLKLRPKIIQPQRTTTDEKKTSVQDTLAAIKKKIEPFSPKKTDTDAALVEKVVPKKKKEKELPYTFPALDLLRLPLPIKEREIKDDLAENSRILEEILSDFDVEAKVIEVNRGPVITRYELEPASGVKVHKITSLSDNIALAMKALSVRIVAPVPGKGTIGVEVPNLKSVFVYMREVIETKKYLEEPSKLKLALGKDIGGDPLVTDLAAMPHLLIAGATGSGKTVCVNSIVTSLLFNATPAELKFIMVDPKKVELAPFNDLPHLLCPVVTDYKKVPIAMEWLVQEMEKRYELFARAGVRNIDLYNRKAKAENWEPLHYIIVIIDELADLMLVLQETIENAITRLAQLSRAVGIHMILATQRPSVDVITGIIKANFPARISFKVASKVDSRTVLDMNGAEKLLGRGDMLFVEPGKDKPVRAQGSLVFDGEIENITSYIRRQREPEYIEEIMKSPPKKVRSGRFQRDEVYEEAKRVILETKQASVSMLQRKLGVGYTKAARLIDMMEEDGIVGPYQGSKPRELLVDTLEEKEK